MLKSRQNVGMDYIGGPNYGHATTEIGAMTG